MTISREVKESPVGQGANEIIAYVTTVPTTWGTSTLSSLTATLYEDPDDANTNVTATKLSGSASVSGQVVTTPAVQSLTAGKKYRLDVKFTSSEGDTLVYYWIIYGER